MSHPDVARLRRLLLPPPVSGGDAVDWGAIERETLLRFPDDYREFVETYGGGEIDEYLSVKTPPAPGSPYGDVLDRINPALPDPDQDEDFRALGAGGDLPPLLPFVDSMHGDVAFWLCEGAPDDWRVVVFRRQAPYGTNRWPVFDGGMASFLMAVLTGEVNPFSAGFEANERHVFTNWRGL
ncbi:SMI1/KNR4 family protein [Embleya sp. NBC_00896]|uniref:SMI1/KNR4 family protein n=1 Tax=Embleya sp. NBC_00896 TaxID=2975961 RepID=UPI002F907F3A|nr:SMI1/KNR4 family protein [Embleya sp. NBC_00896]